MTRDGGDGGKGGEGGGREWSDIMDSSSQALRPANTGKTNGQHQNNRYNN